MDSLKLDNLQTAIDWGLHDALDINFKHWKNTCMSLMESYPEIIQGGQRADTELRSGSQINPCSLCAGFSLSMFIT